MPNHDLPEGFKNHETYWIEDAARYWAAARYDVPLGIDVREERTRFARQIRLATDELRAGVPIQQEKYWGTVRRARMVPDDSYWGHTKVTYPEQVQKTREYFRGPDLAAFAKEKGCPGLFGFEEPQSKRTGRENNPSLVSEREEPKVLAILSAIIKAKYGPEWVADLVRDHSTKIGIIQRDVERFMTIDPKTLRKYLKRLPL